MKTTHTLVLFNSGAPAEFARLYANPFTSYQLLADYFYKILKQSDFEVLEYTKAVIVDHLSGDSLQLNSIDDLTQWIEDNGLEPLDI